MRRMPRGAAWCLLAVFQTFAFGQNQWYRGNIHTHTSNSDGEEIMQGVVNTYKRTCHFLFITDHNKVTDAENFPTTLIKLFNGEEVTTPKAHFNALGIDRVILPDGLTYQQIIDHIHAQNGLAVLNHPRWKETWFSGDDVMAMQRLDFIEMFNGMTDSLYEKSRPNLSLWDYVLSRGNKVLAVVADDMHKKEKANRAWIMVISRSLQRSDILDAMQLGRFYCTNGVEINECKYENGRITVKQRNGMAVLFVGKNGKILKRVENEIAEYDVVGDEQYVRVEIYNLKRGFAFTQPIIFHDPNRSQYQLSIVSGDFQNGRVKEPLAKPLTMQLRDSYGRTVANESVVFKRRSGVSHMHEGADSLQVLTDERGIATATLWLECTSGEGVAVADVSVKGVQQRVCFHANVQAGPIQNLTAVSGDKQQGLAGSLLPAPLLVRVTDQCGDVLSNKVVVQVLTGHGRVNENTTVTLSTDVNGQISIYWRLGNTAGEQTLRVYCPDLQRELILYAEAQPCTHRITSLSGDQQTATVATTLSTPLCVRVYDCLNLPAQALVHFQIVKGEGLVGQDSALTVLSDEQGKACANWTLGARAGQQQVRAGLVGDTSFVLFSAQAVAAGAQRIQIIQGADQTGIANYKLAQPLRVQAFDHFSNPVTGCPILFSVDQGSITPHEGMTDAQGIAEAVWQLGPFPGEQAAKVSLRDGLSLLTIRAKADRAQPAKLMSVAGDGQTGVIHSLLADSLSVMVRDSCNYPVPDCLITFSAVEKRAVFKKPGLKMAFVSEPNNTESDSLQVFSDAGGKATVACRLGCTPGDTIIVATVSVAGLEQRISFRTTITPGPPFVLAAISGSGQRGLAGEMLPEAIIIKVVDRCENALVGQNIHVSVLTGDGLVNGFNQQLLITDQNGQARVHWRLGTQPGEQTIGATCDGLEQELVLSSAAGVRPWRLAIAGGDAQSAAVGSVLPMPLCVVASDSFGNPAPQCLVQFRIRQNSGVIGHDSLFTVTTDDQGRAEVRWTLGSRAGLQSLEAALLNESAQPVMTRMFYATALAQTAVNLIAVPEAEYVGTANHLLPQPVRVQSLDIWGNPVKDAKIQFKTTCGVISPQEISSDSLGMAAATWRLGPRVGLQSAQVYMDHATVPALTLTAFARRSQPALLTCLKGDKQIGVVNAVAQDTLTVVVLDSTNNPVHGYPLSFRTLLGLGAFQTNNPDTTDINGCARMVYRPTCVVGKHIVRAEIAEADKFIDFHIMTTRESEPRRTVPPLEVNPACYQVDIAEPGRRPYIDQAWAIAGGLDSLHGCYLIKTGQHHQQNVDDPFLSFSVSQSVDVWVAFDQSVLSPPDWLTSGFERTGHHVTLSLGGYAYSFWRKTFGSGTVCLGGNAAAGFSDDGDGAMYFVVIKPKEQTAAGIADKFKAPDHYALLPNFPNPFNPTTNIVFQQPVSGRVRVQVFDLYGQAIATLIDGPASAGVHTLQFDGSKLASGLYFVHMQAEGFTASRRILLLK